MTDIDGLAGLASLMNAADLSVEWLGQSGVLLTLPSGAVICIDPYLSHAKSGGGSRERLTPIPRAPWQLGAHLVVTTHDHVDHFDEITLRPMMDAAIRPMFVGPTSCRTHWIEMGMPVEHFLRLDHGETIDIAGIRAFGIRAEHGTDSHNDAIGVMIAAEGYRIYHTGDTEYTSPVAEHARDMQPDIMFVPINGRGGNMNAEDAARLTNDVQPRIVVPVHYGMFPNNTADPQDFVDACRAAKVEARVVVMTIGAQLTVEGDFMVGE